MYVHQRITSYYYHAGEINYLVNVFPPKMTKILIFILIKFQ